MFSESVDQKPIMPVSCGMNTTQNSPMVWNFEGPVSRSPMPPARRRIHTSRTLVISSTSGAAQFSNTLTAFMPRKMMKMFRPQKMKKVIALGSVSPNRSAPPSRPKPGHSVSTNSRTAWPPR
jgi:hypothetical protein